MIETKQDKISRIAKQIVVLIYSLMVLFPLLWLIMTSFKTKAEIFKHPFVLLPENISFTNFSNALKWMPFDKYYVNTFITSFGLLALQLVMVTLAGYAFGRIAFPGRDLLFMLFLTQLMITPQSTIFPNYLTIAGMGLLNTRLGVMLPYIASANGTFQLRQAFKSIPQELEDAGILDGCNLIQLLWYVYVPCVRAAILAYGIISVTFHWNEFLWPLLVTETAKSRTLTVGLAMFAQQAEGGAEWGLLMSATLMVVAPILIAFIFFQKKFISSFITSGVKG